MNLLTGEMIYNAAMASNKFAERETWEHADQQRYNDLAERLNQQLAEHQTQPLEQQYRTEVQVFRSSDFHPYEVVRDAANAWLKEHSGVVILDTHANAVSYPIVGSYSTVTEYCLTLIVELPVETDEPALTLQEAAAINAVEDEHAV